MYRRVLRQPGVLAALLPYVLSRLSATMLLLSLLLFSQHETHSFALAGAVSAAFACGSAAVAPLLGRTVDARGQWPVLVCCAIAEPLALVAFALLLRHDHRIAALVAAAVSGAVLPPVTSCMRAVWPSLTRSPELADTCWAIEGLVVEATELGGPLLAGALVFAVSPLLSVLVAAALAYLGAVLFGLTKASQQAPRATPRPAGMVGPLRQPSVVGMLSIIALASGALAATEVAIAHVATAAGSPGATGVLAAIWLTGSLLGGWLQGRHEAGDLGPLMAPLLLACGLVSVLPILGLHAIWLFGALLFVAGLPIAPATAAQFCVMSRIAPAGRRTETFTWASTAGFLGVGAGSAVSGLVVQSWGTAASLTLSAGMAVSAATVALTLRRMLSNPMPEVPMQRAEVAVRAAVAS